MPLRPRPAALSGPRNPRLFLHKLATYASPETPRWSQKKIWDGSQKIRDAVIKSDNALDNTFKHKVFQADNALKPKLSKAEERRERRERRETQRLLKDSYAKALVDRVKSFLGKAEPDFRKMSRPLQKWRLRGGIPPTATAKLKWVAHVSKLTRQVKFFRVWFLDYHIIKDLGLIIERLNRTMSEGVLEAQFSDVKEIMRRITCSRHVEQVTKERKQLFAIANTLRSLEVEVARPQSGRKTGNREKFRPHLFPSSMLRTVEMNLLKAEVLSMELIVRKALLEGSRVQQKVFKTLKKLGYKPDFPELPDFDEEE
ncbi:hypothetical protein F4679DRAFT_567001 [Xylaria curta]|nr:hypothetical protein F4679DRAFT_567001 [Xylaria curta]